VTQCQSHGQDPDLRTPSSKTNTGVEISYAAPGQPGLSCTQLPCAVSNVPLGHSGHCQDLYTLSMMASGRLHCLLAAPGVCVPINPQAEAWICHTNTPKMKVCKVLPLLDLLLACLQGSHFTFSIPVVKTSSQSPQDRDARACTQPTEKACPTSCCSLAKN